jgi:hypothetical protein
MRNLASTVFMLIALLLAACAQGPAGPYGPPYDSGDKDGGGGGSGM